jgi:hypothetical protein
VLSESVKSSDYDSLVEFLCISVSDASAVLRRFAELSGAVRRGTGLAQFVYVPGARRNRVVLVAHADTVWDEACSKAGPIASSVLCTDGVLRSGSTDVGIGVDDRAGCAILWLLRSLGHSLLITSGEECGLLGSKWLMRNNKDVAEELNVSHQFMVQLDRENAQEYKCYGVGSEQFRAYVEENTGYREPDRKRSTDIVELCQKITGVNLSIGYYDPHKQSASLKIQEWQATLDICRKWLGQSDLPKFVL